MNYQYLTIAATAGCALLAGGLAWLAWKVNRMDRVRREFYGDGGGVKIDDVLAGHNQDITRLTQELGELGKYTAGLAQANRKNFQKAGFVRFDPFGDAGGAISFTVALLDANDDGVVITSLHGRDGNRVYAKEVSGGASRTQLTGEESEAIKRAGEGR